MYPYFESMKDIMAHKTCGPKILCLQGQASPEAAQGKFNAPLCSLHVLWDFLGRNGSLTTCYSWHRSGGMETRWRALTGVWWV